MHGGAFSGGGGSLMLYDGRFWAPESDMILVTVNYRLGALGFLMWNHIEEGETTVGNYGIMDQAMALQWVHENIENFGGNKDQVQLFGQSAGAISVMSHLVLPQSQPLFTSAVMHSNPFHIAFKEAWEGGIQANMFGKEIGCPTLDKTCLR